jgi:hypothetical protein
VKKEPGQKIEIPKAQDSSDEDIPLSKMVSQKKPSKPSKPTKQPVKPKKRVKDESDSEDDMPLVCIIFFCFVLFT